MDQHPRLLALFAALVVLALSGPAVAQSRIGVAAAVNPQADLTRGGATRTVVIGSDVAFEDRIVTADAGLVQVLFEDGSTFTVGPGAQVVIDAFVYDPATGTGELAASVTQGALRFVGGRISKNNNAVRFKTRSGTLVVRGGILNLDLSPPCLDDGRCPSATASLVFGRELLVTLPNGRSNRIYDAGYSFALFGGGAATTANVVPTGLLNQSALQAELSGRPGQSGGAPEAPTEADVVESGVVAINSGRAPQVVLPRPKPVTVQSQFTPDVEVLGVSTVTNVVDETIVEQADADFDRDEIVDEETEETVAVRVVSTPSQFTTSTGAVVSSPGVVNIVGGNASTDRVQDATLLRNLDGEAVALVVGGDRLPVPATLGVTTIPSFQSELLGAAAVGKAALGPDEFLFYYLQPDTLDGAEDEVVYVFDGAPSAEDTVFGGDQVVRTYELSDDFQRDGRGIPSKLLLLNPLIAQEFGDALSGASQTPYLIALREDASERVAQGLYAGLMIDGAGAQQRSAVTLDVAAITGTGSGVSLLGQRRGSYRLGAGDGAVSLAGGTLARASADGESSFFGSGANNFVYSAGPDRAGSLAAQNASVFQDLQPGGTGFLSADDTYSAMTAMAQLADETAVGSLTRTERTLLGYAAAIVEPVGGSPVAVRSFALGGFQAAFDPSTSTLGGRIVVVDLADTDPDLAAMQVSFGSDLPSEAGFSTTRSAFVDDDRFAAVSAGPEGETGSPTTVLITDGGSAFSQDPSVDPGTYVVSSDLVPAPQLFADAGVTPCECEFLEWGWWGTATTFKGDGLPGGERQDNAHLGTWSAGDITRAVDLPTTGTGTYSGHAVGNVVNGGAQYVAAGGMDFTYDFAARTGNLEISNFDGRTFSGGVVGVSDSAGNAQFFGALSGSGVSGSSAGAFANGPNGPAQGVIGSFGVSGTRYNATGTFVGER